MTSINISELRLREFCSKFDEMKIKAETLIADLAKRTRENLQAAEALKQLQARKLNWKRSPESWSALECLEHLNLYGDYYIPEITHRMEQAKHRKPDTWFKSGLIGNFFAEGMLPKENTRKMKTFKDKNPAGSKLEASTIDRFIAQQEQLLQLLEGAQQVSLTKTKTSISITSLLKLRLGDTFRVVIYHNQRHIVQAQKAVAGAEKGSAERHSPRQRKAGMVL